MSEYLPCPADTSGVSLPPELLAMTEIIAENVHEVWAAGRVADGWEYGPERNDGLRQTPCLVPYGELTDEEKAFDRATAISTLQLIHNLGFKIVPKEV